MLLPENYDITRLLDGYRHSMLLMAACELDIFTTLAEGSKSAKEVANRGNIPLRPVEALLDACASIGLLAKDQGRYRNSPFASKHLAKGRTGYKGNFVRMHAEIYGYWAKLMEMIRSGKSVVAPPEEHYRRDIQFVRRLVYGLYDSGKEQAKQVADALDLTSCRKILDVGAGSGIYGLTLLEKNPKMQVVLLDLPEVTDVTREIVSRSPYSDRVELRSANYYADKGWEGFDLIFFSKVLRQEGVEARRSLLERAYRGLNPKGRVAIHDTVLSRSKTGPGSAPIQNVSMLLMYPEGGFSSFEEWKVILSDVGFKLPRVRRLEGDLSLITARKPA